MKAAPAKKSAAAKPAAKKPVKANKKAVPNTTPAKIAAKAKAAKAATTKKAPVSTKLSAQQKAAETTSKQIAKVLDTNKAEDIVTLNIREKCSFADYMIVASGRAPRHVAALADYVADMLKKQGNPALSIEGKDSGDWVLIDAGDVVVHIFRPEVRQFYNIEKMWSVG